MIGRDRPKSDTVELGLGNDGESQFEAMVYRAQASQTSLSVRFSEAAARAVQSQEDVAQSATLGARQLSFDFFAETRFEEVSMFRQRTQLTAEGLEGTQRTTFMERSQQVAARFEMSLSISGVVLSGFAGTSEELQDAQDNALDLFMQLTEDALGQAADLMNEIFGMMDGLLKGTSDFEEQFTQIMNELFNLDLGAFGGSSALTEGGQASQFSMQLEFKFEFSMSMEAEQTLVMESDPITLDLDGDGIELSSYTQGARFDITGSGRAVTTAFVTGGDAFLAFDRNGNGLIDSGAELFGDQNGAANGFEELRKFDTNGDGRINALDFGFDDLLLFMDDGDGRTESGELLTLDDAGIAELSLNYRNVDQRAAGGNRLGQIASYRTTDGAYGQTGDVTLNYVT